MSTQPIDPTGANALRGTDRVLPGLASPQEAGAGSPAFRVLLERLQVQAEALEERSKGVDDPSHLSGAVDDARASLQDALSLGEELLEAFREVQYQMPTDAPNTEEHEA